MSDHLPHALRYHAQGFRPIPTREKKPLEDWEKLEHQAPAAADRHRWWPGTGKSNPNIALVLGPACNLLVLNVNVKHGVNGLATLQGRDLPETPTIRTPSGGRAYLFRPPDPTRYPSAFGTYVYPKGFDGLEFRGSGGIQVMPPSRTTHGAYTFVKPWTLTRIQAQLADLPLWLLEAWLALDARENFGRDRARNGDYAGKAASALARTTDLTSHSPQQRWQSQSTARPQAAATPETTAAPPTTLTTITTTLSSDDYMDFKPSDVETHDDECASHVCGLVRLDVASLQGNWPFLCVLPGHRESTPSATWFKTTSGHYIYHDWHVRSGEEFWPVPDVFAALVTGTLKRLPKPSRKTWRLRLMVEAGLLDPYPVEMKSFPADMPKLLRHFCERFRYLCACKWTYQERAPTMFSDAFAAGWCGIREGSIWKLRRLAIAQGFLVAARDDDGRLVYLPGKEHSP
jgi:hypothetical protein